MSKELATKRQSSQSLYQYTYYYDQITAAEMSYKEYLQRDITESIEDILYINTDRQIAASEFLTRLIKSSIDDASMATTKAIYNNAQDIQNTLKANNKAVTQRLDMVARQLGTMQVNMNMGLARLDNSVWKSSEDICKRLDKINDILSNPRLTKARELYNMALPNYRKGFYEEALTDLHEAVQYHKTDYFSWFLMGLTYLFGMNKSCDVVNLDAAIEAFEKASRFLEPDTKNNEEAKKLYAEICFFGGLAEQTKAMDELHKKKAYKSHLEKAKEAYMQSYLNSQNMLEALYNRAKCNAVLGDVTTAMQDLETIIYTENRYCVKAEKDNGFTPVKNELNKLFNKLREGMYPKVKQDFNRIVNINKDFKGQKSQELKELLNKYLPNHFNEDTPLIDVFEAKDNFTVILKLIETEAASEKKRLKEELEKAIEKEKERRENEEKERERIEKERQETFIIVPQLLKEIKKNTTLDFNGQTKKIIKEAKEWINSGDYEDYKQAKDILEEFYTWETEKGDEFYSSLSDFDEELESTEEKRRLRDEEYEQYEREQARENMKKTVSEAFSTGCALVFAAPFIILALIIIINFFRCLAG